ncbi:transposase [Martelella sp. FOR1707]
MLKFAADPKHFGVHIGMTAVLHTWGWAMTHHPHVHMIMPGGGIALDGKRWVSHARPYSCRCACLESCSAACYSRDCFSTVPPATYFLRVAHLADRRAFVWHLSPVRRKRWVVYAEPPFAGPEAVFAYLSRHTHRLAISNRRMISFEKEASPSATRTTAGRAATGGRS